MSSCTSEAEPTASNVAAQTTRKAKASDVRHALEHEILTGVRRPSERLDEQAIAAAFGVSRTPVREAFQQLAVAGLIELIKNRGAFVRRISIRELVQMFEVMAELEAMAGRLAARRYDAAALVALERTLETCQAAIVARDADAYYTENERFHFAIYDSCGNAFLAAEARKLHQRLKVYRRLQLRVPRRMEQSLSEHRRIVSAIAAGDAETAGRELRGHVEVQGERFGDFIASVDI